MQRKPQLLLLIVLCTVTHSMAASEERIQRQQQLDAACEAARERQLMPLRKQYIEECIRQGMGNRMWCEWFYHDYGDTTGRRAALFYDLPACIEAFEYRRSYRRAE